MFENLRLLLAGASASVRVCVAGLLLLAAMGRATFCAAAAPAANGAPAPGQVLPKLPVAWGGRLGRGLRLPPAVTSMAFSADGKLLAAATLNTIQIWGTSSGAGIREIRASIPRHKFFVSLAFSPDGTMLAGGIPTSKPFGSALLLWKVESGQPTGEFDRDYPAPLPGLHGVVAVEFSPDGKYLAIGTAGPSLGPMLRVLDLESRKIVRGFASGPGVVVPVTFSSDGKLAADWMSMAGVLPLFRGVSVWDIATGKKLRTYKGCSWLGQNALAFSPDGRTLADGGDGGKICLWDVRTGEKYPPLRLGHCVVFAIAFSPDGKTLASASSDNIVRLWDVDTGRELKRCAAEIQVVAVFSSGAQMLATRGRDDRTVHLWDVNTCTELHKFTM